MLTKITTFERLGDFRLRICFNDGSVGTHDFAEMVAGPGSMFQPLQAPDYFGRVFLECGALTWPNGCDVAPEWLRRQMVAAGELTPAMAL